VGGASLKGDAGSRLIEARTDAHFTYFNEIPAAFVASATKWRVAPLYHIFGSEELSAQASVVDEKIPAAYAAISMQDAARLGVQENATVIVRIANQNIRLPIKISATLAIGSLGLPVGLVGIPAFVGETWAQVMQEAA
jgi:NADH-quinone oxidoreductase subunit G